MSLLSAHAYFLHFQHFQTKAKDRCPHLAVDSISEKNTPNLLSPKPTNRSSAASPVSYSHDAEHMGQIYVPAICLAAGI